MREKLIALVNNVLCHLPWGEISSHTADDIADHLIANGVCLEENQATSDWIPVTERLPEDWKERVLVKIKDANNIIGHPDMDTDRHMGDIWVRWGHNVTHWMPLPEPPKGE